MAAHVTARPRVDGLSRRRACTDPSSERFPFIIDPAEARHGVGRRRADQGSPRHSGSRGQPGQQPGRGWPALLF